MGMRDVVIGGLLGLLALDQGRHALGFGMYVSALIAVTDFLVVSSDRRATRNAAGRPDAARVLHASGAVGLVVTGTVLLAGC
jgi:hypothetical protein